MKKILVLVIASGVLFLCGCRAVHTPVEDISDTASSENDSSEISIIKKDVRINDKRLDFFTCIQLSDNTLLFYNIDESKGAIGLITVSYPDMKIIKEDCLGIKAEKLNFTKVSADKSDILIYNCNQAIKLNSDLKR
jgi:hypothetical protein